MPPSCWCCSAAAGSRRRSPTTCSTSPRCTSRSTTSAPGSTTGPRGACVSAHGSSARCAPSGWATPGRSAGCMVAPDLAGQGLGGWLLRYAEAEAPADVETIALFTGARSTRNIGMYERAGFRRTGAPAPPGAVSLLKPRTPLVRRPAAGAAARPDRKSCRSRHLCAHIGRTSAAEGAHGQVGDQRRVDAGAAVVVLQGRRRPVRTRRRRRRPDRSRGARPRQSPPPRARPRPGATGWPCGRSRRTGPAPRRPRRPRTRGRRALL